MVVLLDLEQHNTMLGSGPNQYIQPDYLGPLPSTLDSKQSPLALLAQTCSQIGADSSSATPTTNKTLIDPSKRKSSTCSDASKSSSLDGDSHSSNRDRPKSSSSSASNSNSNSSSAKENGKIGRELANGKISPGKISPLAAFRPYEKVEKDNKEANKQSSCEERKSATTTPTATPTSHPHKSKRVTPPLNSSEKEKEHKEREIREERKRPAEKVSNNNSTSSSSSSTTSESKKSRHDSTPTTAPQPTGKTSPKEQGASPIIRSGLEVLQGDYRKLAASAFGMYPPTHFDPTNPAFRPPFFGAPPHAHPLGAFPPTGSPYIGYSRVKSASGGESIVPVCKDPYCTGCQFGGSGSHPSASSAAALMAAAAAGFSNSPSTASSPSTGFCPAGCVHPCDHPRIPFSSAGMPMPPSFFPSLLPTSAAAAAYTQSALTLSQHSAAAAAQRPYVCNWIVGDSYCGKRFVSSEELLQHLRTHPQLTPTSQSSSDQALAAAMLQHQQATAYSNLLANSSMASLAMHNRNYPTPPLSPLSAARYNPYAAAAAAMAKAQGLFPPPPPSLAGLYSASPYASLYGQKIPQVHP